MKCRRTASPSAPRTSWSSPPVCWPARPSAVRAGFPVGAKSPLTNGIKEANCGGNVGLFLGRFGIKAIVIEGLPADDNRYVLKIGQEGSALLVMNELKGLGTYETDRKLREKFGKDVGVLCYRSRR